LLAALLAVAGACKEKTAEKPKAAEPAVAQSAPPPVGSEAEQIAREAQDRPQIPITAERVIAAFDAAGLPTVEPRQVLAADVNARYCKNVRIPKYTIITVICEYATPADAEAGRQTSISKYGRIKGREVFVNGSTTLTVALKRQGTPSTDEWGMKVIEAFQKLQ
jgi:hypothetical protein